MTCSQPTAVDEAPAGPRPRVPCACGRQASIYLYARRTNPIPACSPCAVELIGMGWTPERSELSE